MRKIKTIEELKKYVEYLFFNTTKIDFTYEDYEYMCTWGMDCSNEEVAFAFGILYDINKQTNSILIYCLKDDVENIYVKNNYND